MTRPNPFDQLRTDMAADLRRSKDALSQSMAASAPYDSVKLSPDEEALAYDFPESVFPDQQLLPGEARRQLKERMGAKAYHDWVVKMAGRGG